MKRQLFIVLVFIALVLSLKTVTAQTNEPWPPFYFKINTSHADGQIDYRMGISSLVDWNMSDLTWRMDIPEGTRLVSASAEATTRVSQEGNQVVFFTSVFHKPLKNPVMIVEVIDPNQTVFTTNIRFDWQGDFPGTYALEDVLVDITKENYEWGKPNHALSLGFMAKVGEDDTITYNLYPRNNSNYRMWDLRINLPIPEGAEFLQASSPSQFSHTFDGQEVYFKAAEMPADETLEPLRVKISTAKVPDDELVTTSAWIVWKNAGYGVGWWINVEESYTTGDIVVKPRRHQQAISDVIDDVPLPNYDVTSLVLQDNGGSLQLNYYLQGPLFPDDPVTMLFFIDTDCQENTGMARDGLGVEYRVRYDNKFKVADLAARDEAEQRWLGGKDALRLPYEMSPELITINIPYELIGNARTLCWTSVTRSDTKQFNAPFIPGDRVPDVISHRSLVQYTPGSYTDLNTLLNQALANNKIVLVPLKIEPNNTPSSEEASSQSTTSSSTKDTPQSTAQSQTSSTQTKSTATPKATSQPTASPTPTDEPEPSEDEKPTPTTQPPTPTPTPSPTPPTTEEMSNAFIQLGDEWQYMPGWEEPDGSWFSLNFEPTEWYKGKTTIGYGDADFETNLSSALSYVQGTSNSDSPEEMVLNTPPRTDFTTLFLRREFQVNDPDAIEQLTLNLDYEDGFVAYLNGVEVARRGLKAPGTPLTIDTPATDRRGGITEIINISDYIGELSAGDNVLAFEVHRSFGRSNLYISPALTWGGQASAQAPQATKTVAPSPTATRSATTVSQSTTKNEATATTAATATNDTPTATPNGPVFVPENPGAKIIINTPTPKPTPEPNSTPTATVAVNTPTDTADSDSAVAVGEGEATSIAIPVTMTTIPPTPTTTALDVTTLLITPEPPPMPLNNFSAPDPNPSIIDTIGKIALPIDNGYGLYDVHVFTIRFGYGWATHHLPQARQPNISHDGLRMVVNREGAEDDNVAEYSFLDGSVTRVSDNVFDSFPVYDSWAERVTYSNPRITLGPDDTPRSHILVQCSLLPPHQEPDSRCREIRSLGVLVGPAQIGPIEGTHPVWADNDQIIYQGCNTWLNGSICGLYSVSAGATRAFSDGATPFQLTDNTSDIPTDSYGNYVALMSQREGNWEVYVMGLDGNNIRNLSSSPATNDGLPTISPDGNWVAFVSDREGRWGVWAVPLLGGAPQKLFDIPSANPWGTEDRSWTNERLSWGP